MSRPGSAPVRGLSAWAWALSLAWLATPACAQPVLSEILFNPPGSPDAPHEYIELRGRPNELLTNTYLICLEGDAGGNPGVVQDVFDLSGCRIGGNGFLVLLQKGSGYAVVPGATVLINVGSGPGWGSGPSSSIRHVGKGGQTDLENGSETFLLIQTTNPPVVGWDADADNDGALDGSARAGWNILDSVGVLDADGPGDIAYGAINFRWHPGAQASNTVVNTAFFPSYVGRTGNTTTAVASAWVASDQLGGVPPNLSLGNALMTVPASLAFAALNHVGGPNFGAARLPGVMVIESGYSTEVSEDGAPDSYSLALNTQPAGNVTIRITAASPLLISTDNGASYGNTRAVTLSSTTPYTVRVKVSDDTTVDASPHFRTITHAITSTADPAQYPTNSLMPEVTVRILDNDYVLLNELKVNPPGTNDGPYEFVEVVGRPEALLTNVYFVAIEGDAEHDPGKVRLVVDLSGRRLGTNGLLMLVGPSHPYRIPPATPTVLVPALDEPEGALDNGTATFMLVSSVSRLTAGTDLDRDDDGVLEGLPWGTTVLDSVGWSDGGPADRVYTPAVLTQSHGTPDAASRYPADTRRNQAEAWFNGNLLGPEPGSLAYDPQEVSADFPVGTDLTPGVPNDTAPLVSPIGPVSGVIGDPTNPVVLFAVDDAESGAEGLSVWATSSNPAVVPDDHLSLSPSPGGSYVLRIEPVGVGYATLTVHVSDGTLTQRVSFAYAASAMGRPGGRFHLMASDASAAVAVDSGWMVVGDDEDQGIRLYSRYSSGWPVATYNFGPYLNLVEVGSGGPREADIESATRLGNRIFWMGSHSFGALPYTRTNRARVFATDLVGSGPAATLQFVGRYEWLKDDLVNWDRTNGHGKGADYYGLAASTTEGVDAKAPDGSGFNIEGLCFAPNSSTVAYIGFRAPLIPTNARVKALIVPVTNFATLAISNGPPGSARFGPPIELNLGGRGIRSIECGPAGCLIVAGPPGQAEQIAPRDFRLFTWSGQPGDRPQLRAADLRGLVPEAIVELPPAPWTPSTTVQLLSDNGTTVWYGDNVEAKRLDEPAFKKFRSDWVALGEVVIPQPAIVSQHRQGNLLTLTWTAEEGRTYRVEWTADLQGATWTALPGDVLATDALASKTDLINATGQRFYRVVVLP